MHCYEQCGIIPYTTCTRTQSSGCTPHSTYASDLEESGESLSAIVD